MVSKLKIGPVSDIKRESRKVEEEEQLLKKSSLNLQVMSTVLKHSPKPVTFHRR
jgi:hypothetical protein